MRSQPYSHFSAVIGAKLLQDYYIDPAGIDPQWYSERVGALYFDPNSPDASTSAFLLANAWSIHSPEGVLVLDLSNPAQLHSTLGD